LPDVVDYVIKNYDFDINIRRESDGSTPFQLAFDNQNSKMCDFLKGLGADETLDDGLKWPPEKYKEYAMNIVWLDLEMTSLENPEILECAVIITDKNLKKLAKSKLSCISTPKSLTVVELLYAFSCLRELDHSFRTIGISQAWSLASRYI
jgi:hypothetical protein